MMYLLKLLLYCFCLTILNVRLLKADGSFEDADQVNEFITMSFSSSHPYDLRQTIPGEPEIDYPIYSAVPRTNFDCNGRHEGYYADTEARCQVFRICANTDLIGKGFAFLCPNGTLFSQKNFVCDWYRNVDCNDSERFYSKNDNNRIGTKTDMMKTVRQMMEHPMKTISIALSRGKPTTSQPRIQTNFATIPTKTPRNFQTISSSPASIRIPSIQDNFNNRENQVINVKQDESASRFSSPLQETSITGQNKIPTTASSEEGFKPINIATLTITPPSPTFTPPFETPLSDPYGNPLSSENISFDTYSSATQAGSPLSTTEESASEKEVYVSSLGELSTDPGANFNRQTSNVIADSPSNALETEAKPLKANGMNFAEKVNAGLNGLQVVNQDEIIAPEYVKNIMQNNVDLSDDIIQPVSFDFASNINGLLDEVNYEAQLEAQNSVQFQQPSLQREANPATKKPFRFLSRGFSHDKSKDDGAYNYKPTSTHRNTFRSTQHSTSTQSYSNSLITTLLTTTQPPVTSTETTQILGLENVSEKLEIESATKLNTQLEASSFELNQSNNLVEEKTKSNILETLQNEKLADSQVINKLEPELETQLESKLAIKREPKELKQLDSVGILKDLSQELNDEDKVNANKRAEDLLLAGVKQITVNEPDEKGKATEEELNSSIVPIYNRVTAPQTSTPHITSSSTTSTISTTTSSSTMPTTEYSSSTDIVITSSSTPTVTPIYYPEPSTTPATSIRRFTVGSGKRRQTSRPISYARRNNSQRSGPRTTTSSLNPVSSTTAPTYRGRSGVRSTSTTTTAPNTTKITTSSRKRLNVNRYTYGSRRRTTETLGSNSATTTTVAPLSKKLNDRNSDSALSDLTGAASTYNGVSNRAYNSIRQNSNKYTQVKRRHPSHKNIDSEITTTKPLLKNSTTQQPRSSSSYPTPTLAPFSHHEALSPMPTSSTTPAPLPATFLSFNDLTKSITDDSILQTLRKNQAFNKQLIDSTAFRSQQQALPKQQIPFSTQPRIQQLDYSTQRTPLPVPTKLPFIPLKDFIASKFGAQYSPEPPKLSTGRPALIPQSFNNDFVLKPQNKPVVDQQYTKQQYGGGGVRQEFLPQTNQALKLSTPVQYTVRAPLNQNVVQQQSQLSVQQQQQQQYQEQQLRLQQQQQKLQQLKQQQNHLQQQYQLQQQQKLQQQKQQQEIQQQQKLQQHQVQTQQHFSTNQQQIIPAQQYSQLQHSVSIPEQQQKLPIQQQRNSMHLVSTKIVPSVEQQFHIQRSQQILQPISLPPQSQRQQSQYQIIPSQMTVAQTIPPQQTNINFSSNFRPEIGSINVRLPSNLAGLIPNSNIFDLSRDSNSLDSAQRRSDQKFEDAYGGRERKSVFTGVSSYDVPLSSVGRLTNDITNFLQQRRL